MKANKIQTNHVFFSSADFFKINLFKKKNSGSQSEGQTVCIQILVQTVCKDYQQTTKVAACNERVKKKTGCDQ